MRKNLRLGCWLATPSIKCGRNCGRKWTKEGDNVRVCWSYVREKTIKATYEWLRRAIRAVYAVYVIDVIFARTIFSRIFVKTTGSHNTSAYLALLPRNVWPPRLKERRMKFKTNNIIHGKRREADHLNSARRTFVYTELRRYWKIS